MSGIAIVIVTDGRRDCLERTVASLQWAWGDNAVDRIVVVDDSCDREHWEWIDRHLAMYERVRHMRKMGFGGAIQSAWREVGGSDFIFHLEDDFIFNEPIDVVGMCGVLNVETDVAQMALKRQPWSPEEIEVGGFMEQHPEDYHDRVTMGHCWCWQRRFFTTNPSFYRGSLTLRGWPNGPESEGRFGLQLLADQPEAKFGFWGHKADPPRIHHIGEERVGSGY